MNVTITSKVKDDYLLIKASGKVIDIEEWKLIGRRYYDEIAKHDTQKVIIDGLELQFPAHLLDMVHLVKFYKEELPSEIRRLKLAVVVDSKDKKIVDFWETYSHNRGYSYRAFYSMEDARKFMGE